MLRFHRKLIFHIRSNSPRNSCRSAKAGSTAPEENSGESKFIGYHWNVLGLRSDPEQFEQVWQVLVEEWMWDPISDEVWVSFTNVPCPVSATAEGQTPRAIVVPDPPEPPRPPYADSFVGR